MKKFLSLLAAVLLMACATTQPKQETPAAAPEAAPAGETEVTVEIEADPEAQAEVSEFDSENE